MIGLSELAAIAIDARKEPTPDPFLESLYRLDETAVYYRFLYRLARMVRPKISVELGVCTGRGTAHMAGGNMEGVVYGIDPSPLDMSDILARFQNIILMKDRSDSGKVLSVIPNETVDICFVDSEHTYDNAHKEVNLWTSKLKNGGVFIFDDVEYNEDMKRFWDWVPLQKIYLPGLHYTGFGAAIKG